MSEDFIEVLQETLNSDCQQCHQMGNQNL